MENEKEVFEVVKTFKQLKGKVIFKVTQLKYPDTDDNGWLYFEFEDGTNVMVTANYGDYTGNSIDEYQTSIGVSKLSRKGVVINGK